MAKTKDPMIAAVEGVLGIRRAPVRKKAKMTPAQLRAAQSADPDGRIHANGETMLAMERQGWADGWTDKPGWYLTPAGIEQYRKQAGK